MIGQPSAVAGYDVPLHRSLTEPVLIAGAPRSFVIPNGTLAAAIGLGLRLWIAGLLIWVIGHALAVYLTGQRHVERQLTVQPTLTVRPGWPLRVIVHKDLVLKPYRQP